MVRQRYPCVTVFVQGCNYSLMINFEFSVFIKTCVPCEKSQLAEFKTRINARFFSAAQSEVLFQKEKLCLLLTRVIAGLNEAKCLILD